MQKLDEKLNENLVGANCICPHFGEITIENQKGITLIALIITIIVMLILVGVTINVVLTGDLFDKAEKAKKETVIASEKEQLLNSILGTLDDNGKINLEDMELPKGFKKVSEDSSKVIYEGPSTNQYEVDKKSGQVEELPENKKVTPTPPNEESQILGLYGNKEDIAIELLEDGKAIMYSYSEQLNGEYDDTSVTFTILDENGEEQTMKINYSYDMIKDEETNDIINKILYLELGGELTFLTTQKTAGLNLDLYDNKHFISQNTKHLYFYKGWFEHSLGSLDQYYYCVNQGYIWTYDDENISSFRPVLIINSDGTLTEIGEGDVTGIAIYSEVKTTE